MVRKKIEKQAHWLNKSQMAASLDISVQAFDKWGVQPVAKIGREQFFEVRSVIDNRLDHQTEQLTRRLGSEAISGNPESLDYQRLRLTKEQADSLEIKNELARAKVVPISLFTAVLTRLAGEVAGILDTLPLQIRRKHPTLDTQIIDDFKWHTVKAQNAMARLDSVVDQVVADHVASIESD